MAIRDDFAPGEVLTSADLNDTFANKVTYSYGTATPSSPSEGDIWFDENTTPPTAKFYDGSSFQTFSAGAADFSDSATGTYTDTGVSYKYITFTASGTLTITRAGFADVLVLGGGGGGGLFVSGYADGSGGGGSGFTAEVFLPAATHTVTIGGGGAHGLIGSSSLLGPYRVSGGSAGGTRNANGVGASGTSQNGLTTSLTGTSVGRGGGGGKGFTSSGVDGGGDGGDPPTAGATNTGGGGGGRSATSGIQTAAAGGSGVVIVRVRTN